MLKGKEKQLIPANGRKDYLSAVKEFTKMTIQNPSFFNKTAEEQKEIAKSYLPGTKSNQEEEKKIEKI